MDDISSQEQVVAVLKKTMESQNVRDLDSLSHTHTIMALELKKPPRRLFF
jgi:hypothetical protein